MISRLLVRTEGRLLGRGVRWAGGLVGSEMQAVLDHETARKVRMELEERKRPSMPYSEFLQVAHKCGAEAPEADTILQAFHKAGVALYLPNAMDARLKDTVIMNTQELQAAVDKALKLYSPEEVRQELTAYEMEYAPIADMLGRIERKARFYGNVVTWGGLSLLSSQFVLFAYLTWGSLSWDIMEPITYFAGQVNVILGYVYFIMVKRDHSFEDMWTRTTDRRRAKLMKKYGIDEEYVKELREEMEKRRVLLRSFQEEKTHAAVV